MIEMSMYFGLGFLAACLLGLLVADAVWRRAVRLTTKRIQAALPLSLTDIKADRDQLRADFAMSARKLEVTVEDLKKRTSEQLLDISKKNEQIRLLLTEVKDRSAALEKMEAGKNTLHADFLRTEATLGETLRALRLAEERLTTAQADLVAQEQVIDDSKTAADERRIEIAALKTAISDGESEIAGLRQKTASLEGEIAGLRRAIDEAEAAVVQEKTAATSLRSRLEAAERTAHEQAEEVGRLQMKVSEQSASLSAQLASASQSSIRFEQLLADRNNSEAELLRRAASAETRNQSLLDELESLKADKALLEGQLKAAREDRENAVHGVRALEAAARENWEKERIDSALLRERINDLAAEITAMTIALEGEASPAQKLLMEAEKAAAAPPSSTDPRRLSLADRIRALQERTRAQ